MPVSAHASLRLLIIICQSYDKRTNDHNERTNERPTKEHEIRKTKKTEESNDPRRQTTYVNVAVRRVEARHVHAEQQQLGQLRFGLERRTQRAHTLGLHDATGDGRRRAIATVVGEWAAA